MRFAHSLSTLGGKGACPHLTTGKTEVQRGEGSQGKFRSRSSLEDWPPFPGHGPVHPILCLGGPTSAPPIPTWPFASSQNALVMNLKLD